MTTRHLFSTAVRGLAAHKSRSLLTILGIVIGITAIILVIALGRGAEHLILGQIQAMGSKVIAIIPGREPSGPSGFISTFTDSLKPRDLEALQSKANVPHLSRVMPIVFGSQTASFREETYRPTIFGGTALFTTLYDIYPAEGRQMTDEEVRGFADVAVIGHKVKEELFPTESPLNEKIRIKGRNLRVIGVLPETGQLSFLNFDEAVIIPYTTAQQYIFGKKHFDRIILEADSEDAVAETVADVKATLRNQHNITDPEKDDFFTQTQENALQTVGAVTGVLTMFLASIAAISLLVGGVGIMNIMLVSVTERTREIGLRKALGATESDVLRQFLLEAVILTALGGVFGIILGGALAWIISFVLGQVLSLDWIFVFPWNAAALGLAVAAGVGLLFGIYPARQAAKKSPMEALRYE